MAKARGCFKNSCLGCLSLFVLILLFVGVVSLLALKDAKNISPVDVVHAPLSEDPAGQGALFAGKGGTVILNLNQGDFVVEPAKPGQGLVVEAIYDDERYNLDQTFTTLADSTWQYELNFLRSDGGFRSFMSSVFSKGPSTKVKIFLPPEVPLELKSKVSKGGLEVDLGGLWLKNIDLNVSKGGFALEVSEPLKEPVNNFIVNSNMGGFAAANLGNASPKVLDVSCNKGGADIDLSGNWRNSCDIGLDVRMGGLSARTPRGIKVIRGSQEIAAMAEANPEIDEIVMKIRSRVFWGEIEIIE
ncbi:MAG: hypothetical protein GY780_00500 [bacterium]|nr:hypothetical protein [bacterium]